MDTLSPQRYARLAGGLYLLIIAFGMFGELAVRGSLVVSGDAAATAARIMASPERWRVGIALDLLMHVFDVFVMWGIYVLLRPVSRTGALLVLLFNLVQTAVLVANKLLLLVPLMLLDPAPYLRDVPAADLQALAYTAIRLHEHGFGFGLVFFGVVCLLEGRLIRLSGFLPRWIGLLMQVAGVCYIVNTGVMLLAPALQSTLFPFLMLPVLAAELSLATRLATKGVDEAAWRRRAGIASAGDGGSHA